MSLFFRRDEDELEEKIEQLNRRGLEIISKSTGLSKEERKQRLIECRTFLAKIYNDEDEEEDTIEFIEKTIHKQYDRLFRQNEDIPFNALEYLEQEEFSDEEEEAEEQGEGERAALIFLSDSEDDEDAAADDGNTTDPSISPPQKPLAPPAEQPRAFFRQLFSQQRQRVLQKDSRASLLISLRQKVHQTAVENYCHQRKIQKEQFDRRLEIADKCRQLVEILKEKSEEKSVRDRAAKKAMFRENVSDRCFLSLLPCSPARRPTPTRKNSTRTSSCPRESSSRTRRRLASCARSRRSTKKRTRKKRRTSRSRSRWTRSSPRLSWRRSRSTWSWPRATRASRRRPAA